MFLSLDELLSISGLWWNGASLWFCTIKHCEFSGHQDGAEDPEESQS